jgi:hypothetical protein
MPNDTIAELAEDDIVLAAYPASPLTIDDPAPRAFGTKIRRAHAQAVAVVAGPRSAR